jgi:glycosyltransferase involved in cell wall biosynthesis
MVGAEKLGRPMKILFVAPGNSIHSKKWIDYFALPENVRVEWISFEKSVFDTPVPRVPRGKRGFVRIIRTLLLLRRMVRQFQPDVIHVHSVARYGLFSLFVPRRRLILTPWGSDVLVSGKKIVRRGLLKLVLRRAQLLTCDALHMRDELTKLGVGAEKVLIVNFGIDCNRFTPEGESTETRRDSFTILSTRNLEPIYDVSTLVRAIPIVTSMLPQVRVKIAGAGSQLDALTELTKDIGVSDLVEFVGRIPNEDLPDLLRSVDLYVSTSLSDAGIAGSTAEAMATGVPVVVTNTGENHLWIHDGVSGFLFDASDERALAKRILEIHQIGSVERSEMIRAARLTILERNDYANEMAKALVLYRGLAQ